MFVGVICTKSAEVAVSHTDTGLFIQFMINNLFARNTATTNGAGLYYNQPRPINIL
ncbi:MAG: hypothetical protein GY796_04820 [Chloroflexi bacterium]|nr:hypothetical protein [Chloroflexota bacterium]